jgi:Zn finger protein HypA/HybF involved in hydrogenase expression
MARKPKIEFEFTCKDCGHIPEPDKEKSNENWNVIIMTCPKCGGKINMKIKE